MLYNFDHMDPDSFEWMVRSLNEKVFGVRCEQYGLGPDGQREFMLQSSAICSLRLPNSRLRYQ